MDVKSREVTVKGPLGVLKRSFKHASADIFKKKSGSVSKVLVQSKLINIKCGSVLVNRNALLLQSPPTLKTWSEESQRATNSKWDMHMLTSLFKQISCLAISQLK